MTCHGCEHPPHEGNCSGTGCECGICTPRVATPYLARIESMFSQVLAEQVTQKGVLDLVAARTEYLVQHVLDGNEELRQGIRQADRMRLALEGHIAAEDDRMARIEAKLAALGNGGAE